MQKNSKKWQETELNHLFSRAVMLQTTKTQVDEPLLNFKILFAVPQDVTKAQKLMNTLFPHYEHVLSCKRTPPSLEFFSFDRSKDKPQLDSIRTAFAPDRFFHIDARDLDEKGMAAAEKTADQVADRVVALKRAITTALN